MYENIIQFIIPFVEIFIFSTTVTWIQAGFPIFTLMMINKTIATEFAQNLFVLLMKPSKKRPTCDFDWDNEYAKGDRNEWLKLDKARESSALKYLCLIFLLLVSPYVFIATVASIKFTKLENVPQ